MFHQIFAALSALDFVYGPVVAFGNICPVWALAVLPIFADFTATPSAWLPGVMSVAGAVAVLAIFIA